MNELIESRGSLALCKVKKVVIVTSLLSNVIKILAEKLNQPILEVFSNLFEEFKTKSKLKSLLPVSEESRICPICKRNQEATEFVFAIILAALDSFLTESPEFTKLLIEKGYAK